MDEGQILCSGQPLLDYAIHRLEIFSIDERDPKLSGQIREIAVILHKAKNEYNSRVKQLYGICEAFEKGEIKRTNKQRLTQ